MVITVGEFSWPATGVVLGQRAVLFCFLPFVVDGVVINDSSNAQIERNDDFND